MTVHERWNPETRVLDRFLERRFTCYGPPLIGGYVHLDQHRFGRILAVHSSTPERSLVDILVETGGAIRVEVHHLPSTDEPVLALNVSVHEVERFRQMLIAADMEVAMAHVVPLRVFTDGGITIELDEEDLREPDRPATVVSVSPTGEFNRVIDV